MGIKDYQKNLITEYVAVQNEDGKDIFFKEDLVGSYLLKGILIYCLENNILSRKAEPYTIVDVLEKEMSKNSTHIEEFSKKVYNSLWNDEDRRNFETFMIGTDVIQNYLFTTVRVFLVQKKKTLLVG